MHFLNWVFLLNYLVSTVLDQVALLLLPMQVLTIGCLSAMVDGVPDKAKDGYVKDNLDVLLSVSLKA